MLQEEFAVPKETCRGVYSLYSLYSLQRRQDRPWLQRDFPLLSVSLPVSRLSFGARALNVRYEITAPCSGAYCSRGIWGLRASYVVFHDPAVNPKSSLNPKLLNPQINRHTCSLTLRWLLEILQRFGSSEPQQVGYRDRKRFCNSSAAQLKGGFRALGRGNIVKFQGFVAMLNFSSCARSCKILAATPNGHDIGTARSF